MKTVEYKIKLPFSVEESQIGSIYTEMKLRKEMAGVEVIHDQSYSGFKKYPGFNLYDSGRYTYMKFKVSIEDMTQKIPSWLLSILELPEHLTIHQETWNSFPYILTVTTIPGFFKQHFHSIVETYYGTPESTPSEENYQMTLGVETNTIDVVNIDIANDKIDNYEEGKDPAKYKCPITGKGPLTSDWQSGEGPFSLVSKMVTVEFNIPADLFGVAESMMVDAAQQEITSYFRSLFCFSGEWAKLNLEEVTAVNEEDLKSS